VIISQCDNGTANAGTLIGYDDYDFKGKCGCAIFDA
jgi:hypothetical protein